MSSDLPVKHNRLRHLWSLWREGLWAKLATGALTIIGILTFYRDDFLPPEQQAKLKGPVVAKLLSWEAWAIAALLVVIGWLFEASFRSHRRQATALAVSGNAQPDTPANIAVFVKEHRVNMEYIENKGIHRVIRYSSTFVFTGHHLRIFVEYQQIGNLPGDIGRIKIGDVRDFVRDGLLELSVMSRDDPNGQLIFYWGPEPSRNVTAIYKFATYRARILLLDDEGKEQYYYFLVTGGKMNDFTYPNVIPGEKLEVSLTWGR